SSRVPTSGRRSPAISSSSSRAFVPVREKAGQRGQGQAQRDAGEGVDRPVGAQDDSGEAHERDQQNACGSYEDSDPSGERGRQIGHGAEERRGGRGGGGWGA